jgi:hypothetical protein
MWSGLVCHRMDACGLRDGVLEVYKMDADLGKEDYPRTAASWNTNTRHSTRHDEVFPRSPCGRRYGVGSLHFPSAHR